MYCMSRSTVKLKCNAGESVKVVSSLSVEWECNSLRKKLSLNDILLNHT